MITPDTKDWTWVLDRPCPDCGFDPRAVDPSTVGDALRADAAAWQPVLALPDVARRPHPEVWSPLEYAAHVRDVHRVFAERLDLMLATDDPEFANWDQDETALEQRYDLARPDDVAPALVQAAEAVASRYDAVPPDGWARTGRRSNGSVFTVDRLARYHLHDVVHHAWDVRAAATRAAYEADADAYGPALRDPTAPEWPASTRGRAAFADAARAGAGDGAAATPRVLEIGSGPGRDALLLEAAGLSVRRTDVAAAFVRGLRADGHLADVLDPLTDDLDDLARPGVPYDGVWASACLLHVGRDDLPVVLARLAGAVRDGAPLWLTLKEGDGDGWSVHGRVRAARSFTYWREAPLREALADTGWRVLEVARADGDRDERWLLVLAARGSAGSDGATR